MMTAVKHSVSWVHVGRSAAVRRTLFHHQAEPCIEAARLISDHPCVVDIEVLEVDSGRQIDWRPEAQS